MKVKTSHTFPVKPDTFWHDVYFNKEYNKTLYMEQIRAEAYDLLEFNETDDEIRRKVRIVPEQKAPTIIQKIIRGKFSYIEEGIFSKKEKIYRFTIIPSIKAEKINISGEVTVVSEGEGSITRTINLDLKTDIFGIGGQIEKFVGGEINKGYDSSYGFTLKWIEDHNLK